MIKDKEMIKKEDLVKLASYVSIIHHTKGRIRLRVSPSIKKEAQNFDADMIKNFPKEIDGIKNVKINKLIGSITINYDEEVFAFSTWEDLVSGNINDELMQSIEKLIKDAQCKM